MGVLAQIAVVPIITGILTGLFYLLIVYLIDRKGHMDLLLKVLGGIASLGITLYGIQLSTQQNRCEKEEKSATEVVDLLQGITFEATNEIGLPSYCHNRSGQPMFYDSQTLVDANNKFNAENDEMTFKITPFLKDNTVTNAKNAYDSAMIDLLLQCSKDADFSPEIFFKKQSILNDARSKLVSQLGRFINNYCYK